MTKTFTEDDLVRFLYNELNTAEADELREMLVTDEELRECLNELQSTVVELDKLSFQPSQRTIDRILQFSKEYQQESV